MTIDERLERIERQQQENNALLRALLKGADEQLALVEAITPVAVPGSYSERKREALERHAAGRKRSARGRG